MKTWRRSKDNHRRSLGWNFGPAEKIKKQAGRPAACPKILVRQNQSHPRVLPLIFAGSGAVPSSDMILPCHVTPSEDGMDLPPQNRRPVDRPAGGELLASAC